MKSFIFIVALVAVLAVFEFNRLCDEPNDLQEESSIVVEKGSSLRSVARKLKEANIIKNGLTFYFKARFEGLDKTLKAGEYAFAPKSSINLVLAKIAKGEVVFHKITLPDGLTTGKFLYIITAEPKLSGEISLQPEEGDMLPETYTFELNTPKDEIVRQAVKAMNKVKAEAWERRNLSLPLKNVNQLITLASIIEKETSVAEERTLVASVFVNRLNKRMRLQTDPTVIYAVTEGMFDFERVLSKKDLQIDSPYNTYKNYGLPPSPICNPSPASIEAAGNPEMTDYLYFVADGKGGHNFSKSLNEHNQNVKNWRKKK